MPRQRLDGPDAQYADVRSGIVDLLKTARAISARSINAVMTATYWEIGRRIVESEMRGEKRADYGERLVERLAVDLTEQFGRGFGKINLWRMRAFFQAWPEKQILSTPLKESRESASLDQIGPSHLSSIPTSRPCSRCPGPPTCGYSLSGVRKRGSSMRRKRYGPVGPFANWTAK